MDKTTILIPKSLRVKAARRAKLLGISLGELIRRKLLEEISDHEVKEALDPIFHDFDKLITKSGVRDTARNHDRYLYDE